MLCLLIFVDNLLRRIVLAGRDLWFAKNTYGKMTLRSNAFITVVKSLELWYCDDLSDAQNLARKRTLLAEPQVRSRMHGSNEDTQLVSCPNGS